MVTAPQNEEEQEEAVNMTLFGFEQQYYDPTVTTALGHRVFNMCESVENVGQHQRLTADLLEHLYLNTQNND